jgi:geranylgeranyl diphosphate synthase type I
MDDETVARIQQTIVDTGALDELEKHIATLTETAVAAIEDAPIVDRARAELVALAEYVSWRSV